MTGPLEYGKCVNLPARWNETAHWNETESVPMSWLYRDADQHKCQLPRLERGSGAHVGDVWQCDECQKLYIIHDDQLDGPYLAEVPETERTAMLQHIKRWETR